MDDGITIEIEGLKDADEMLGNLASKVAERVIRKALRAGAKFEQQAQASAAPLRPDLPSGTALPIGALSNDVVIRVQRVDANTVEAIVGPGGATKHASNWVEYGHRMVKGGYSKANSNGSSRGPGKQVLVNKKDSPGLGTVPAHPYIRPTFEATETRVVDIIATTLKEEITKASEKGGNAS